MLATFASKTIAFQSYLLPNITILLMWNMLAVHMSPPPPTSLVSVSLI